MAAFSELYRAYLNHRIAQGHIRKSYYHLWATWASAIGEEPLEALSRAEIASRLDARSAEKRWSPATRTAALATLSSFCEWACQMGHMQDNPCRFVPRVSGRALANQRCVILSRRQFRELLRVLSLTPDVRDAVLFAYLTGLRFSVITCLTPSDIRQDRSGWAIEIRDKNADMHTVYLVGRALEIVQRRQRTAARYLFSGPRGGRITQKYMRRHLYSACRMVGIPTGGGRDTFSFHRLRAMFATALLEAGEPLERVMKAGNWRSYEAVRRYDCERSQRRRTFAKMAKLAPRLD